MPLHGQYSSNASERSKYQRKYNSQPEQKKRRAQRNSARRAAQAVHGKAKLKGKDVDHTDRNKTGSLNNNKTRIVDASTNRSMNGQGITSSRKLEKKQMYIPSKPAKENLDKKTTAAQKSAQQMKKKKLSLSGGAFLDLTKKMVNVGKKSVGR